MLPLMACSAPIQQVVRTEYVYQQVPDIPKEPNYFVVHWQKLDPGLYCVDEKGAKGLLKNFELIKENAQEMRTILQGLKDAKKDK